MRRSISKHECEKHNLQWGLKIQLRGGDIKTPSDLYARFSKYIKFPSYFWDNWDAFWDTLTDRDFIYEDMSIYIYDYDQLFNSPEDKKIFCRIIIDLLNTEYLDISIDIQIISCKKS